VVGRASQIWVTTDDRKVYPAVVVGSDPRSDLAVLKIPARGLRPVTFATGPVRRGQWTMAIGNPYGLAGDGELAVSVGVVSAVGRSLPKLSGKEDRLYQDLIQTTAQINPGNSGGPLFDLAGHVIGVNCAVILPVKQTNGIGFALPMRRAGAVDHRPARGRAGEGRTPTSASARPRRRTPTSARRAGGGGTRPARRGTTRAEPGRAAKLRVGDSRLAGERSTRASSSSGRRRLPVGRRAATVQRGTGGRRGHAPLRPRGGAAPVTTSGSGSSGAG
jgi:hypothetical protein